MALPSHPIFWLFAGLFVVWLATAIVRHIQEYIANRRYTRELKTLLAPFSRSELERLWKDFGVCLTEYRKQQGTIAEPRRIRPLVKLRRLDIRPYLQKDTDTQKHRRAHRIRRDRYARF